MHALAMALMEQLRCAFERAEERGTCQFDLADEDGHERLLFHITVGDDLRMAEGQHLQPDVTIRATPRFFETELLATGQFDLRDPRVANHITFDGRGLLAERLINLLRRPTKEIRENLDRIEKMSAERKVSTVERVERPSDDRVLQAYATSTPIIATGMIDEWTAPRWNLEKLKARFGKIALRPKPSGEWETFGEFIRGLEQVRDRGDGTYSDGCVLPAAMCGAFKAPFFRRGDKYQFWQLWMGSPPPRPTDPVTTLHRDLYNGMLGQVFGRKRFTLYSPDQGDSLYPRKDFTHYQACWVQPWKPDLERFPRFKNARPIEIVLHPGEVLVLPFGWYHLVYALEEVMSVGYVLKWSTFAD